MRRSSKTLVVVGLALALLVGAAGPAAAAGGRFFSDEAEAPWAKAYLAAANLRGLMVGDPDGRFRPNDPLRREELVTALVRFAGLEGAAGEAVQAELPFADAALVLEKAAWARGYLAVGSHAGILPEEEGEFRPGEPADRLWASRLLVRALGLGAEAELRAGEGVGFADVSGLAPEDLGYLAVAVERGLLQGFPDGTFRPAEPLTRAQLAALLERAALWRGRLGEYEVRGTVAEVVDEEKQEVALHVDGLRQDLRRYPVSPDALVLVGGEEASLEEVEPGFWACLVLNPEGAAVVVSARPVWQEAPVRLRGWLVDLPDLEGADTYGLVPGLRWGRVKPLLDENWRLREEVGPGEGSEWRVEGLMPVFRPVAVLVPADEAVAAQMEALLGKFVQVSARRVPEPNLYMRPVFRVEEVRAAEPAVWPAPEPQPQPGPAEGPRAGA